MTNAPHITNAHEAGDIRLKAHMNVYIHFIRSTLHFTDTHQKQF